MCVHVHICVHFFAVGVACTLEQVFWAPVHVQLYVLYRCSFDINVHIFDTFAAGCAHMCIWIYMCICMHIYMNAYVRLWYCLTCRRVVAEIFCLCIGVHVHVCVYACACMRVYVHAHMYVYANMCVCVYVCIYMYMYTTFSGNKVDARASHSSILWKLEFIGIQISSPHLSILRRQSMWLVFQFARLVTCVAPSVVGSFPANPQRAFSWSADTNSIKNIKRKIAWRHNVIYCST